MISDDKIIDLAKSNERLIVKLDELFREHDSLKTRQWILVAVNILGFFILYYKVFSPKEFGELIAAMKGFG